MFFVHSDVSTGGLSAVVCVRTCGRGGGGWQDRRVLCGLAWRGRLVCDCVWDVVMGDRHVDVLVLLDGACSEGWCARLLLLLRSCAVLMLSYNLDYG